VQFDDCLKLQFVLYAKRKTIWIQLTSVLINFLALAMRLTTVERRPPSHTGAGGRKAWQKSFVWRKRS